jgi:signal peptidase I
VRSVFVCLASFERSRGSSEWPLSRSPEAHLAHAGPLRMPIVTAMVRRIRWLPICVLVAAGGATAAFRTTVSPARQGIEPRLLAQADSIETVTVPSESMEPTLPVGSKIEADYDAFDDAAPGLGDIVIFNPPRSAEHIREDGTYRCGARRRPRQMCAKPVRPLTQAKYLKRVVGLPGDRLRLRRGRLIKNGHRVDEPFADRAHCHVPWADCHFPRRISVPPNHYFLLGDNRGRSHDSRHWGPVPRRALLARVGRCMTAGGELCGDQP